jgi:peptidylprolyl isomerase
MQTAQKGDRVKVHYMQRWQDGSVVSSCGGDPVELTVGAYHRRLLGLGSNLVGLVPGNCMSLPVSADQAYGPSDPALIYRLRRGRFPQTQALVIGRWIRITRGGRRRLVRILEVDDQAVFVDTNHPRAGQSLQLEVKLVAILERSRQRRGLEKSKKENRRHKFKPGAFHSLHWRNRALGPL